MRERKKEIDGGIFLAREKKASKLESGFQFRIDEQALFDAQIKPRRHGMEKIGTHIPLFRKLSTQQ